jgi:putative ABC transport system permease protein
MMYAALGRLKDGITIDQAAARMSELQKVIDQQHVAFNKGYEVVELTPWLESVVGQSRSWMLMLLGAVGLVLLISCANVANLVLAHGSTRVRELTVRGALGATRWRIARQLLAESILLAAIGGGAGLTLAWWGLSALRAATPATVPRAALIAVDWRVFLFTASAALGTGILCGLLPAVQGSRLNLVSGLKEGVEMDPVAPC